MIHLRPIEQIKNPKDKYCIELNLMHGDADKYENVVVKCKDEAQFEKRMEALKHIPLPTGAGGEAYEQWCEDNFGDYIPSDCIYGQNRRCSAAIEGFTGFYWNPDGIKHYADVI